MPKAERIALAVLAVTSLVLRALAYVRYRFDSDEPQHLHVAWGWTAGLVQYRDVFDNHSPLFHIVTAPILALFGERADILLWMRAPMLPLFAVVVGGTYVLARRFWSMRVAPWSAVLLSLFPPFFLKSLEYRTDNLWNALWMFALLVATAGAMTTARAFVVGLLLGTALAVSMKTTLLVITLGIAGLVVRRAGAVRIALAGAAGFVLVPAIVALYFVSIGAWPNLVYCVFEFNELLSQTREHLWIGRVVYPFALAAFLWWARTKHFLAIASGVFVITLACFWILITPRDFLPVMPLGAIFLVATVRRTAVLAAIGVVFAASLYYYADRFENRTDEHITMMNQVLGLTRPGEPMLDHKGETIYRARPYYYILEAITRAQLERGMIPDTIAEDMVRANCHVSQADGPFLPPRGREWLSANYLDMGRIRAAGQWVRDDGVYSIAVRGEYLVLSETGVVQPARFHEAGVYRFARTDGQRLAVLWAPAFERGYSPFRLRDREF